MKSKDRVTAMICTSQVTATSEPRESDDASEAEEYIVSNDNACVAAVEPADEDINLNGGGEENVENATIVDSGQEGADNVIDVDGGEKNSDNAVNADNGEVNDNDEEVGIITVLPQKRRKAGPGRAKGSKRNERPSSFWFEMCKKFDEGKYKSQAAFLRSADSGNLHPKKNQKTLSRKMKMYKEKLLKNDDKCVRIRAAKFPQVEKKLVSYIKARSKLYLQDKCGLSIRLLQEQAITIARDLGLNVDGPSEIEFTGSARWLSNVLKRNNLMSMNLHGEGMELSPEEQEDTRADFRRELNSEIEEMSLSPSQVYNANQTGIFYNQLPNRLYLQKENAKGFRGVKQMKSKDRVTAMICTSAAGHKIPLLIVGKPKLPHSIRYLNAGKFPIPYTNQHYAWFDKKITMHWINTVFWPYHVKAHGNKKALLILDNCTAHKDLETICHLPDKLKIVFFPPSSASFLQPADMGMVATIKMKYKALMLRTLLAICDDEESYKQAIARGRKARRGCKGMEHCAKANLFNALEMLNTVWSDDDMRNSVKPEGIQRCWTKSGILPATWDADINNDVGRRKCCVGKEHLSFEDTNELCDLFRKMECVANNMKVHDLHEIEALQDSIMMEQRCTDEELKSIVNDWVNIEDNDQMVNEVVEDLLDIELSKKQASEEGDDRDSEKKDGDSDLMDISVSRGDNTMTEPAEQEISNAENVLKKRNYEYGTVPSKRQQ